MIHLPRRTPTERRPCPPLPPQDPFDELRFRRTSLMDGPLQGFLFGHRLHSFTPSGGGDGGRHRVSSAFFTSSGKNIRSFRSHEAQVPSIYASFAIVPSFRVSVSEILSCVVQPLSGPPR